MRPATSRIFQTPFAIDPNDFVPTSQVVTLTTGGSWSGLGTGYEQNVLVSATVLDLATTLITTDSTGVHDNGGSMGWKPYTSGGKTYLKFYANTNSQITKSIRVDIVTGMTYTQYPYGSLTPSGASQTATFTFDVTAVPDTPALYRVNANMIGASPGGDWDGANADIWGFRDLSLADADTIQGTCNCASAVASNIPFTIYRY